MPNVIQTFDSRGQDEEIDRLRRRLSFLEQAYKSLAPVGAIPRIDGATPPAPLTPGVKVDTLARDSTLFKEGVSVDSAYGWSVNDDSELAEIRLTPDTATPTAQSVTGAAGSLNKFSDSGHAHPPVVTTKGDLLAYSSLPARFPVGTNDDVVVADSAQTLGVKYQTRIKTLAKNGSTALTGAVTLSAGSGVSLTQAGQDIAIAATGSSGTTKGFIPLGIKGERWLRGSASEDNSGTYGATPTFPFIIIPDSSAAGVEWVVQLDDFVDGTPAASLVFQFYFHATATGGGANNCKMTIEIGQVASGGTVGGLFAWVSDGTVTFSGGAANTILIVTQALSATILDNRALFIRLLRDSTDAYTGAFGIMKAGLKFTMD